MANTRLIAAIREHFPDDEQTRQAIEGIEHLDSLYPNEGDGEAHIDAVFWESVREIKVAALERKRAAATTIDEVRYWTAQINDARQLGRSAA